MTEYDCFEHQAAYIKLVDCRHTAHVTLCQHTPPTEPRIDRINDDFYYVRSTSEIRPYQHGETGTKSDHMRSIKRAFNSLKKLINCNYDTPEHVRFITLTYADNMQDNSRISGDWRRFVRRMQGAYGRFRWLYVKEQQARGAWHLHALLFFDAPAPYMPNNDHDHPVRDMWGHGWVTVEAVRKDANNLGNYLCAYLTDDKDTGIKGARLLNYEAGVRLYNCSRDIIRPIERSISFEDYKKLIADDYVQELSSRDSIVRLKTGRDLHVRYKLYRIDHE
ncbi:rolling circle replication-associated protein [Gordonibacter urolithinfaciens]|jgi:hypothetical protein|uniref:rolling circle replication-associated protein n=1 Tax=Gordonibacter urolithinfaciens TaxID=1335613 RepID=UPI001D068FFC|nr:hypothetical protein [Gordonibacter urolithinfaciens]MCB7087166.1 hypothetical protein [Gordonibacter urolithinfaciens]